MIVTYDLSRPPFDRVVDALVRCADCDVPTYEPLDAGKIYRVALPSTLYTLTGLFFPADVLFNYRKGNHHKHVYLHTKLRTKS